MRKLFSLIALLAVAAGIAFAVIAWFRRKGICPLGEDTAEDDDMLELFDDDCDCCENVDVAIEDTPADHFRTGDTAEESADDAL